jgi:UPF0755 protein
VKKAAVIAVLAAAGAAAFWLAYRPGEPVEVVIPAGLPAARAAELLHDKGVAPFAFAVRLGAKLTGVDRKLKPGRYKLRRNMPLRALLAELSKGPETGVKIVIPEGFSARQIAERLEAEGVCSAGAFLAIVNQQRLEGYLFPTTYEFEPASKPEKIAAKMRGEFKKRVEAEYLAAEPKPKLTMHQLLTLASIVQREAVLDQEKPMIAAVYLNRMRIRMRLEADPTVQYALGHWKKGLTLTDLRLDSPYNTYVRYGLPPGPICSPGVESFRAAMRPAQTTAIYFVADLTGGHVFSSTHEEHLEAKKQFKRGIREQKRRMREEEARKKAGSS